MALLIVREDGSQLLADEVRAAAVVQRVGCEPFHREILSIEHTPGLHGPLPVNPDAGGKFQRQPGFGQRPRSGGDAGGHGTHCTDAPLGQFKRLQSSQDVLPVLLGAVRAEDGERQELRIVRVARAVPSGPVQQLFDGGAELPRAWGPDHNGHQLR